MTQTAPVQPLDCDATTPSLLFFTLHKCASALFSTFILRRIPGLEHCDYSRQAHVGELAGPVQFDWTGKVYGPLRLSTPRHLPEYQCVLKPLFQSETLATRRALLFVRDPRDVLLSYYKYIRTKTDFSPSAVTREDQQRSSQLAQRLDLDEWVLQESPFWRESFEQALELMRTMPQLRLLRYEDMIDDWPAFETQLTDALELDAKSMAHVRAQTRPNAVEEPGAHKRSGRTGQFREAYAPEVIAQINHDFAHVLRALRYPI
ncbi:MAG: sulfotransferase domain-containing protein [Opitutales bacterium]